MLNLTDCGLPIRDDLSAAHAHAWDSMSKAGTWLTAKQRVAVAAEARQARTCAFCQLQKEALTPNSVTGTHTSVGLLADGEVEAVHRIVSDPGRLSETWYGSIIERGITPEEYIEIAGLVAIIVMADTFIFGIGVEETPLPSPQAGAPSNYHSPGSRKEAAWVPITEPEDVVESDGTLYPSNKVGYIHRALSAVPETKRDYWRMAEAHYLLGGSVYDFAADARAISRPQIEVIAARLSALHQCLY